MAARDSRDPIGPERTTRMPTARNQLVADFPALVETGRCGTWQRGGR